MSARRDQKSTLVLVVLVACRSSTPAPAPATDAAPPAVAPPAVAKAPPQEAELRDFYDAKERAADRVRPDGMVEEVIGRRDVGFGAIAMRKVVTVGEKYCARRAERKTRSAGTGRTRRPCAHSPKSPRSRWGRRLRRGR